MEYSVVDEARAFKIIGEDTPPDPTPEKTSTFIPAPPNTAVLKPLDPNSTNILIVDQVLYKGAIDLRNGGADLEQAIAESIAAWDGVRARHLRRFDENLLKKFYPESNDEDDDGLDVVLDAR